LFVVKVRRVEEGRRLAILEKGKTGGRWKRD
jgi:hypothetical protein